MQDPGALKAVNPLYQIDLGGVRTYKAAEAGDYRAAGARGGRDSGGDCGGGGLAVREIRETGRSSVANAISKVEYEAMENYVKILFSVDGPSGPDVESLWARKQDEGYAIDNIPFYAINVALGDIVRVRARDDGALWFDCVVCSSGHSTIRLWFAREDDVAAVRSQLRAMGCPSELSELSRLVAVDIPRDVPYPEVKRYLDQGEANETFEYEEACFGSSQG